MLLSATRVNDNVVAAMVALHLMAMRPDTIGAHLAAAFPCRGEGAFVLGPLPTGLGWESVLAVIRKATTCTRGSAH